MRSIARGCARVPGAAQMAGRPHGGRGCVSHNFTTTITDHNRLGRPSLLSTQPLSSRIHMCRVQKLQFSMCIVGEMAEDCSTEIVRLGFSSAGV